MATGFSELCDFSELYEDYIVNDISFPTHGHAEEILEYLLAKDYTPKMTSETQKSRQSSLQWFAHAFDWYRSNWTVGDWNVNNWDGNGWDYPSFRRLLDSEVVSGDSPPERGLTSLSTAAASNCLGTLENNVNVLLTLLKIDLSLQPFNEDLRNNVPRLLPVDWEEPEEPEKLLFFPTRECSSDVVPTREATVLFLIGEMGKVYRERGNERGYKKWMEHCRIYLQSVLSTSLVPALT